jgi:hypothetical protein
MCLVFSTVLTHVQPEILFTDTMKTNIKKDIDIS